MHTGRRAANQGASPGEAGQVKDVGMKDRLFWRKFITMWILATVLLSTIVTVEIAWLLRTTINVDALTAGNIAKFVCGSMCLAIPCTCGGST